MRAFAILLVLLSHSGVRPVFGLEAGFVGVEIFFVLSGFLIGQILLSEKKTFSDGKTLFRFYLSRWLRTLPLYFLVLVVKDILDPGQPHWKFYFFLQSPHDYLFFPVSWSLVVEEWFYLLIPLLLIFNRKVLRLSMGWYLFLLITTVWVLRIIIVTTQQTTFDMDIRKLWYLRFDTLLTGVGLSYLKLYRTGCYLLAQKTRTVFIAMLLFCIACVLYRLFALKTPGIPDTLVTGIGQSSALLCFSFSIALFIAQAEQNAAIAKIENPFIHIFFTTFAFLAYPLYLIHFDFFLNIPYTNGFSFNWLFQSALYWLISLLLAGLLHVAIEKPIMVRRKQIIKKITGIG